jgi:hypothetical protein
MAATLPAGHPAGASTPCSAEQLIEALIEAAERVGADRGRVRFVLGPTGAGKSVALQLFEEQLHRRHLPGLRIGSIDCEYTDAWAEIARIFTLQHRLRRSVLRLLPEWLSAIPIIGNLFAAIFQSVRALRHRDRAPEVQDADELDADTASAMRAVRALTTIEPLEHRVIVLDSLDRASPDELAGAFALIHRIGATRTLFVLAARTTRGAPDAAVRNLIHEAERQGRAGTHVLAAAGGNADEDPLPDLAEPDRRLLAIAALEGDVFHSAALAAAAGLDELDVEDRLAALARARVIEARPLRGAAAEATSRFAFRSHAARHALAAGWTQQEREQFEAALAEAVARLNLDNES